MQNKPMPRIFDQTIVAEHVVVGRERLNLQKFFGSNLQLAVSGA